MGAMLVCNAPQPRQLHRSMASLDVAPAHGRHSASCEAWAKSESFCGQVVREDPGCDVARPPHLLLPVPPLAVAPDADARGRIESSKTLIDFQYHIPSPCLHHASASAVPLQHHTAAATQPSVTR